MGRNEGGEGRREGGKGGGRGVGGGWEGGGRGVGGEGRGGRDSIFIEEEEDVGISINRLYCNACTVHMFMFVL